MIKNKYLSVALLASVLFAPAPALSQSTPNFTTGQVPTAQQWNSYFRAKQDVLNFVPLNSAGGFMTGKITLAASSTSNASLNFPIGVAPSLPNNGDMWFTAAGLYLRANGTTIGPLSSPTAGSFTATSPLAVTFPGNALTNYALNFNSTLTAAGGNLGINLATANTWSALQTFGAGATITNAFTATGLVKNSDLVSPTVAVNGVNCTLGGSCTIIASAGAITVGTTDVNSGVFNGLLWNFGGKLGNLPTANNAVAVTSASGVPSISSTLPDGLTMGTPGSINLTYGTQLPVSTGISGLGTGISTFLSTPSSANLLATMTDKTGTGLNVFGTSPSISAPILSGTITGTYTLGGTPSITGGSINSGLVLPAFGGSGVNNGSFTMTRGGNWSSTAGVSITGAFSTAAPFTQAGAFATTLTSTAISNATLPAGTQTLAALGLAQTWTASQSYVTGALRLAGATSGNLTLNCAAVCGTSVLTLPAGTTDFSATGGAGQFVKQATAGGPLTIVQPAFIDITGTATNLQLANMNPGTIKANNGGVSAAPSDVTGAAARLPSLLNIDQLTTVGNADLTIPSTTRTVATTTTLTAPRNYTLPAASSLNPGQTLAVLDQAGAVNGANIILINRAGGDTINGTSSTAITTQYGGASLTSDGVSKWTVQSSGSGGGGGGGVSNVGTDNTLTGGPIVTSGTLGVNPLTIRGYKSGLTLSTAGSSSTFGVAIGTATDSGDTTVMQLNNALSKTTGAWSLGNGGALDSGSILAATWYHAFIMQRPDTGVVDSCISTNVAGCTTGTNIPAAYTKFRRIGSMLTNASSQWVAFTQVGNDFLWSASVSDANAQSVGTTNISIPLTVPPGVSVVADINVLLQGTGGSYALFYSGLSPAKSANTPGGNENIVVGTGIGAGQLILATNTSRQIQANASATLTYWVVTNGWTDNFGGPAGAGAAATAPSANVLQNYISGYTLSTAGSSTSFGVTTGSATDATNATFIVLQNALTKTTGAWAAGNSAGSLDAGTIAASTWYHAFVIQRADTSAVDVCITTNVSGCATGARIPSAFGYQRRIGSMLTNGAGQWTKFVQSGNEFWWDAPAPDVNGNTTQGTSSVLYPLSVPPGISVEASLSGYVNGSSGAGLTISSPLLTTPAFNSPNGNLQVVVTNPTYGTGVSLAKVQTDTFRQIRMIGNVASGYNINLATLGWTDTRNGPSLSGGGTGVTNVATSGLASGGPITQTGTINVPAASKAEQQAASSSSSAVTPSQQQNHPSAAKVVASFTSAATPVVQTGYNVSSVTKGGVGQFTINFTTPFANTNYACNLTPELNTTFITSGIVGYVQNSGRSTGSVIVQFIRYDTGNPTVADPAGGFLTCFGSQ